jgi:hypothetical protein
MLHIDPPNPLGKGGARKASVADIKGIDISVIGFVDKPFP